MNLDEFVERLTDESYRDELWRQAVEGTLPPETEILIWELAFGPPPGELR